jgi:L-methionine (R)-S-oxide reductase
LNKAQSQSVSAVVKQVRSLLSGQQDMIASAANIASLLFHELNDVNWVGFYFLKGEQLIVGPFQGLPACASIPLGRGVCGTAAATQQIQRVQDVHDFDGHIACDLNSRSEIVIPLIRHGKVLGVLDLDSPSPGRFDEADQAMLSEIAGIYLESIE